MQVRTLDDRPGHLDLMFFSTFINTADDPTRGKEVGGPVRALPTWWQDLEKGLFQQFDVWMFEQGMDAERVSGLPEFPELCGEFHCQAFCLSI